MIARGIQGIAIGAIIVTARAMVPDLFSGKDLAKMITCISMLMPLVLSIAPTIGGYIQEYFQWRIVFVFLLLYFGMLLVIIPKIPETLKTPRQQKFAAKSFYNMFVLYKDLINNLPFVLYGLCSVIPLIGSFGYLTSSPFLFQKVLHLSPSKYGLLSLYAGGSILLYGVINTKLIKIFPLHKLLILGTVMVLLAGAWLLLSTYLGILTVTGIFLPVLLYYSCFIISIANATSQALTYITGGYGTARALLATCQFLAGAFGSFIFSRLPMEDGFYLACCFIVNGILMSFCLFAVPRTIKQTITTVSLDGAVS
jgi:MFS family permease